MDASVVSQCTTLLLRSSVAVQRVWSSAGGEWDEMNVRRGPRVRLLPLLVLLLLVCLCLAAHTAEAKRPRKGKAGPTRVPLSVDARPQPPASQPDTQLNTTAETGVGVSSEQQAMQRRKLATHSNTTSAFVDSKPASSASNNHSTTEALTSTAASASSTASVLLYPALALGAVASTVCLAYIYYRFLRAKSSAAPPAFDALPLLRLLPPNHPAGRAQGSEWAVEQLRWDDDGDCAHDFLGPFAFGHSDDSAGKAEQLEEKLVHEQTAPTAADKGHGLRARKKR